MPLSTGASSAAHAQAACTVVDAAATDLVALSHDIHGEPELAFHEVRSAVKTQRLLAERGFEIVTGQGGLDTAFRATFGDGPLVIGVCAEYDALPGIGHACGHNVIAASAVGTGLALAEVADALGLTVVVIGTPAEEYGGGKALLLKAGAFDDIAAAVMLHPGPIDIAGARSLALTDVMVTYHGKESHAAVAPHLGINAADAVTVAQVSIGLLRQHLSPGQLIHGIVTEGEKRPTSFRLVRRCSTRCAPSNRRPCVNWRRRCTPASPLVRWPPDAAMNWSSRRRHTWS